LIVYDGFMRIIFFVEDYISIHISDFAMFGIVSTDVGLPQCRFEQSALCC